MELALLHGVSQEDLTTVLSGGSATTNGHRWQIKGTGGYEGCAYTEEQANDDEKDTWEQSKTDEVDLIRMDSTDADEDDKSANHSGSDEDDSLLVAYDSNSVGSV